MRYRRALVDGAIYFFTVNLANRRSHLLIDRIDDLRGAVHEVRAAHPFAIIAWSVMPEHMHAVWSLPPGDSAYSMRWNLIKGGFSRRIPTGEWRSRSRLAKGERGIWQRRFWEHLIRDDTDLDRHVAYVHYNPVKHGHAARAVDWPYSSIHRFIANGWVTADWACPEDDGEYGECG